MMNTPAYNFRILPEIGFAVFIAVVIAIAQALFDFDESVFAGDPIAWLSLVGGSILRGVGGAVLTVLFKGQFLKPGEQPDAHTTG